MSTPSSFPAPATETNPVILIVDDNPANLGIIVDYLEEYGFTILVARDGESGLEKARYAQPDLILLDVMMPGIDGFETCRLLKAHPTTQDIPVIFMTALDETEHKVKGFQVGAVDYVAKPLHQEEVLARVNTHLKIRELIRSLQQTNQQLLKINADKNKLFAILAHDLRGSFSPLLLSSELLALRSELLNPDQIARTSQSIFHSIQQIYGLLENLLQWAQLQLGHLEYQPLYFDLSQLVERNVSLLKATITAKQITFINQLPPRLIAHSDKNMIDVVLRNLISNAAKFTPVGGTITLSSQPYTESSIAVLVQDSGVGISPENLSKLFQLGEHHSTPGTNKERGSGLGLVLCYEMMQQARGGLELESQVNQGTTARVIIPIKPIEQ